jgi:chemotaxis protein methyltransferase CheR
MFDDPPFYTALRTAVVPLLRTYPFLDVWLPACSSGEEAYATAIVLHEEGLLPRVRLYATDLSEAVFRNAKEGVFPLSGMAAHAANYRAAGGIGMLSDYYAIDGDAAVMLPALKDAILFSEHSLATDGCFHEFHMIVCRRILWLFNDWLRARVQTLFQQSLSRFGILGLGQPESFTWKEPEARFDRLSHGWYRRMGVPLEA